jgi:hypothetical protein
MVKAVDPPATMKLFKIYRAKGLLEKTFLRFSRETLSGRYLTGRLKASSSGFRAVRIVQRKGKRQYRMTHPVNK